MHAAYFMMILAARSASSEIVSDWFFAALLLFPAESLYFVDSGSMRPDSQENRMKRFVIAITTRSLAAFIAVSFLATLLPAGAVAAKSIMACCAGKSASHCHSDFKSKTTASVSNPCPSDCCTCCAPAQQTRRERTAAQPIVKLASPTVVHSFVVNFTRLVRSREEWTRVNPRGPPTNFVEQIS